MNEMGNVTPDYESLRCDNVTAGVRGGARG